MSDSYGNGSYTVTATRHIYLLRETYVIQQVVDSETIEVTAAYNFLMRTRVHVHIWVGV